MPLDYSQITLPDGELLASVEPRINFCSSGDVELVGFLFICASLSSPLQYFHAEMKNILIEILLYDDFRSDESFSKFIALAKHAESMLPVSRNSRLVGIHLLVDNAIYYSHHLTRPFKEKLAELVWQYD